MVEVVVVVVVATVVAAAEAVMAVIITIIICKIQMEAIRILLGFSNAYESNNLAPELNLISLLD
jgi:hypothetical protein